MHQAMSVILWSKISEYWPVSLLSLYNSRRCMCEVAIIHLKIELGAWNFGIIWRMNMGYVLPNVIRIGLWDVVVCAIFIRLETIKQWLHSGQVAVVGCRKHRLKKNQHLLCFTVGYLWLPGWHLNWVATL